jgi:hypothetical protein
MRVQIRAALGNRLMVLRRQSRKYLQRLRDGAFRTDIKTLEEDPTGISVYIRTHDQRRSNSGLPNARNQDQLDILDACVS